jgi:type II secretory pathway pseudopilin PulG
MSMLIPRSFRRQCGQWSLIGTLVAVAILICLAALYLPKMLKTSAGPNTQEQTAIQDANGVACTEYVSQLNQAVAEYKQDNGRPPASFNDLKRYGAADLLNQPSCSFQMNPTTGSVTNGPAKPGSSPTGTGGVTIPNIPGGAEGM